MSARVVRGLVLMLLLAGGTVAGWYAVEADREVRILCGLFRPGTPEAEMDRILGTAHFLQVEEAREDGRRVRTVSSWMNLRRNGCAVTLADGAVRSSEPWNGFDWLGRD